MGSPTFTSKLLLSSVSLVALLGATSAYAAEAPRRSHKSAAASAAAAAAAQQAAANAERDARLAKLEAAVTALQGAAAENETLKGQNAELKSEVGDLQAQVADLKASEVAQIQDVRDQAAQQAKVSLPNGRPTFATADGKFSVSLRGQIQLDTAAYFQQSPGPTSTDLRRDGPAIGTSGIDAAHARNLKDGTLWRRARIGAEGNAFGDWDYRLLFDFGGAGVENAGQVYEAWVQYSGLKPLRFKAGAFPPPFGLEDQTNNNQLLFLERPASSDISRNLFAGDTRLAAGAYGYGDRWFASADLTGRTVGVVNTGTVLTASGGAIGTAQTYGDQVGVVGRLAGAPLKGQDWRIDVGIHGGYIIHPANTAGPGTNGLTPVSAFQLRLRDTPELRVDGTSFIDTGSINASGASDVGVELEAQKKNFFLQGEYESIHVDRSDHVASPTFSGWYVEGAWTLTGEPRAYTASTAVFDAPVVAHPFSLKGGGLGAWELALRYSDFNLNYDAGSAGKAPLLASIRGGNQQVWSVGLNWYPNPVLRFTVDVDQVHIDRLSPSASAYSTPAGAQIGQDFTAVAIRSQAAF